MKVSNIKDIDKFFSVVDSCEGRVLSKLDIYKWNRETGSLDFYIKTACFFFEKRCGQIVVMWNI